MSSAIEWGGQCPYCGESVDIYRAEEQARCWNCDVNWWAGDGVYERLAEAELEALL